MLYETDTDRKNEDRVMQIMAEYTGFNMMKTPSNYVVDAVAFNGSECKCFFEFKSRSCASTDYDSMIVTLNKVLAASNIARATKRKVWLVVEWTDNIGVIDMTTDFEIGYKARADRGTSDLHAMYPISGFKMLNLYSN